MVWINKTNLTDPNWYYLWFCNEKSLKVCYLSMMWIWLMTESWSWPIDLVIRHVESSPHFLNENNLDFLHLWGITRHLLVGQELISRLIRHAGPMLFEILYNSCTGQIFRRKVVKCSFWHRYCQHSKWIKC